MHNYSVEPWQTLEDVRRETSMHRIALLSLLQMHSKCVIIYLKSFYLLLILQYQLFKAVDFLSPHIKLFLAFVLYRNAPLQNSILSENYCKLLL